MNLLTGKVALITGAARGIGKAIALRFAAEGADIAFSDLNYDEHMSTTEAEIAAVGVKAKGYASNAALFSDSEKLIVDIINDFGKIDILVNNAGITRDNLLLRMTEQDWDAVLTVNLKSAFNLTKSVQRYMIKQRGGSIINMSSVVGVNGNAGQSNYSASKAGLIGFTKSIAQELGSRGIRCNALAPGFIETEMTHKLPDNVRKAWIKTIPLRRAGKPEDVANVATFLASELSSYVSGQVINVCGGMST
jgi:3-oxoacyl-[acyl-carrier protein] reductase